jgi:hypothetical protein
MILRRIAALAAVLAFVAATADAQTADVVPVATPSPAATPTATPTPSPTPSPAPTPNLVQYTGQLLDYRNNYVFFTSGDAFPAVDAPRIIDYFTGYPTSVAPTAKMYARATFDPATKKIIELAITKLRLQTSRALGPAEPFVKVASTPIAAPELAGGAGLTGRQVAVVFEVTVPPTTNLLDSIYIATDYSDWSPTAIKLDRVDAYKYRALRYFASGTKFAYRVTRGTWNSVERGEDNLDAPPHQFFVREVDALSARVTVYHWSDDRGNAQGVGPNSLPTPYNPSPFGGGRGGIGVPQVGTPGPNPNTR